MSDALIERCFGVMCPLHAKCELWHGVIVPTVDWIEPLRIGTCVTADGAFPMFRRLSVDAVMGLQVDGVTVLPLSFDMERVEP